MQYGKKPAANEACKAMAKHDQIARLTDKLHEQGNFELLGGDLRKILVILIVNYNNDITNEFARIIAEEISSDGYGTDADMVRRRIRYGGRYDTEADTVRRQIRYGGGYDTEADTVRR